MMFKLGKILLIAIMSCLITSSCKDDEDIKLISVSVPQISLNIEEDRLLLIDSEAELNRLFANHTKELPQIDFRNYKMLLVHGSHRKQIKEIVLDYFTKDENIYYMSVSVSTEDKDKDSYWAAAYLIPRSFKTPIALFLSMDYRAMPAAPVNILYFK